MMKLVVDARMINASGIGVYLKNVLEYLFEEYEITLLGDPKELIGYVSRAKVISFVAPIYSIEEQLQFRKVVPICDIFWSPHYNVPLSSVKAKYRVTTIHDVYHLAYQKELSFAKRIYARLLMNKAVKLSNSLLTVSNFSKKEIVKYTRISDAKITVIYNGVLHNNGIGSFKKLRKKYNLPNKYILYVGNVKPHKNLKKLLEAYLLIDRSLTMQYKVVIVGKKDGFITGDPVLMKWIQNTPELGNHVIFTGFAENEDMDTIYYNASIFVFPSIYEGFGLPPLEAMANGCPVLVSNQSCLPEICAEAALYFDPYQEKQISVKMSEMLTNEELRSKLINLGIKHSSKFSWEKSGKLHLTFFKSLISNNLN